MAMELWVLVVEETLPQRIRFLEVFGDDNGDSFGEDFVRCFCFLCFGSGGRGELSAIVGGAAVVCSGVSSISGGRGMRVVVLVLFALGMELVLALWGLDFRVGTGGPGADRPPFNSLFHQRRHKSLIQI